MLAAVSLPISSEPIVLAPVKMVTGGAALAREPSGRVVFVDGALPGEEVSVTIVEEHRDFARAHVVEVLSPSPDRVEPFCPHAAQGCGGCPWAHIEPSRAPALLRDMVVDSLRRLARIEDPPVRPTSELPSSGYRTSVRILSASGRPAFRRRHSHEPIEVDGCPCAHPLVGALLEAGRFDGASEVELRAGVQTGERLVVAHPSAARLSLPEGVTTIGSDELADGRQAAYHEDICGHRYRISATAFFQVRPDGAELLCDLVTEAIGTAPSVVDLYAGTGLFAAQLASRGARVVAVEGSAIAADDARHNVAGLDVRVIHCAVRDWEPERVHAVVADPSRAGLGREGVDAVVATTAGRVVLVSCEPAALARDARLLVEAGYELTSVQPIDLFPHTAHVETVSIFER